MAYGSIGKSPSSVEALFIRVEGLRTELIDTQDGYFLSIRIEFEFQDNDRRNATKTR
jgi:hypothetical protein